MTEPEWDCQDSMAYQRGLEDGAAAERERLYTELGNDHYVIFTEDRWTIEHSVECRLSGHMHECDVHAAVARLADSYGFRPYLGRWRITEIDSGVPILERAENASIQEKS